MAAFLLLWVEGIGKGLERFKVLTWCGITTKKWKLLLYCCVVTFKVISLLLNCVQGKKLPNLHNRAVQKDNVAHLGSFQEQANGFDTMLKFNLVEKLKLIERGVEFIYLTPLLMYLPSTDF